MLRILLLTLLTSFTSNLYSQTLVQLGLNKAYHGVSDGYTLFAPLLNSDVYLINNCGELMHQWDTGTKLGGNSVELLEDGRLLKTSREHPLPATAITGGGGGQFVELIDWDGTVLWQYEYFDSATVRAHHDVEFLPNGNVLILAWDLHEYNDCIDSGRDPNFLPDSVIWSEHIIEVDPNTDQIVWEWWLWDHVVQDFDSTKNNYGVIGDHPELMDINFHGLIGNPGLDDWIHANSIAYNPELDQIVMNSRHTGEFYIIDHSTTTQEAAGHTGGNSGMGGDILYRWGNPVAYDQGNIIDGQLFGAHDVQWIADSLEGPNKLLVFNNGWQRISSNDYSNVLKLELPWNAQTSKYDYTQGTAYEPQAPYWEYLDTVNTLSHGTKFYSGYISGAQALYNGNTFICDGAYGRLFEIDTNQAIVWEYYNPIIQTGILNQGDSLQPFALGTGNPVFRALKYPKDFSAFAGKTFNGTAEPLEGNYSVPYNCAGFASLLEKEIHDISIYPNPSSSILTIESDKAFDTEAFICNSLGQKMMSVNLTGKQTKIDVSQLANGSYYLVVQGMNAIKINVMH
ncbi:MAG: aryl-sulfate sulfotransferase [Fluviicola sp.]